MRLLTESKKINSLIFMMREGKCPPLVYDARGQIAAPRPTLVFIPIAKARGFLARKDIIMI
jgi:hypothetical protein